MLISNKNYKIEVTSEKVLNILVWEKPRNPEEFMDSLLWAMQVQKKWLDIF